MVEDQLTGPMAAWLGDWPTTGGSSLEKLQTVLRRVPDTIRELATIAEPPALGPAVPPASAPAGEKTPALPAEGKPATSSTP
jgi:hypothetical protein